MEFQNKYFTGRTHEALRFYRRVAAKHERGMRFVDEVRLQYWAADLLQRGKVPDAVEMLQLLIDTYYRGQSDRTSILARRYLEAGTKDAAADFLADARGIIKDVEFHWTNTQFAYVMDLAIADLRPAPIDEETLLSCAGDYGAFSIDYEGGLLFFSSEQAGKLRMIPLDEATFMLEDVPGFRIQMVRENGAVLAAKAIRRGREPQVFMKAR